MRILKDDTVAVLVDIQEKLFPFISDNQKLVENCIKLIKGLELLEVPLIVTEQYTKGLGKTIPELQEVVGNNYNPIEKIDFSCCGSEEFFQKLEQLNKRNIILMGIEAHVCVLQTAIDLTESGFNVIVIEDCISSRKLNDKTIALKRFTHEGCFISTYESILLELCRKAGNDVFKSISKLIK
ncbi:MAG: hydrolase [Candidatus Sericytochromatia bacterium]